MNKADLVKDLSQETGLFHNTVTDVIDKLLDKVATEVACGREVTIAGFGKFKPVDRPARQMRNPATGEPVQVAAKRVIQFKPTAGLKDRVNVL